MQLLEGQELAGSLVNAELALIYGSWLCHPGASCVRLFLLVPVMPPLILRLFCFVAKRRGVAGRHSVV